MSNILSLIPWIAAPRKKRAWLAMTVVVFLIGFSPLSKAEPSQVALAKVVINPADTASIKRGAKFFASTCMVCHTLKYLRYDKLAAEAGITYDKMPFGMKISGVSPPDLSLVTQWRSPDWIYTYLHSFYMDAARPSGVNNLVFPNTAMLNILGPLQGQLVLVSPQQPTYYHLPQWYDVLVLTKEGSLTPEQFDATITDLVNFLAYAAEPYRVQQIHLGWWVIGFLVIFFIFAYLLKKSYWRDIKRSGRDD